MVAGWCSKIGTQNFSGQSETRSAKYCRQSLIQFERFVHLYKIQRQKKRYCWSGCRPPGLTQSEPSLAVPDWQKTWLAESLWSIPAVLCGKIRKTVRLQNLVFCEGCPGSVH